MKTKEKLFNVSLFTGMLLLNGALPAALAGGSSPATSTCPPPSWLTSATGVEVGFNNGAYCSPCGGSYFTARIFNGSAHTDTIAWCADIQADITISTLPGVAGFCSTYPEAPYGISAIVPPGPSAAFNEITYLLNHSAGASPDAIQYAIWTLLGQDPSGNAGAIASLPSFAQSVSGFHDYTIPGCALPTAVAQAQVISLVADATAHGANFVPGPGQIQVVEIFPGGTGAVQPILVEYSCPLYLTGGDTATIGFWHNKNGQALILSANGGPTSTALGNWLANSYPCLFSFLSGKSNTQVAAQFLAYFSVKGQKTWAQVMAGALAAYVTDPNLIGGNNAAKYGFNVSSPGTGGKLYNVGAYGSVLGLSNNTFYTVGQLLAAANANCPWSANVFNALNVIFDGINTSGDIN